jgi:hypothetical protein
MRIHLILTSWWWIVEIDDSVGLWYPLLMLWTCNHPWTGQSIPNPSSFSRGDMSGELTAEHGLLRGSHGSYGKIIGKKGDRIWDGNCSWDLINMTDSLGVEHEVWPSIMVQEKDEKGQQGCTLCWAPMMWYEALIHKPPNSQIIGGFHRVGPPVLIHCWGCHRIFFDVPWTILASSYWVPVGNPPSYSNFTKYPTYKWWPQLNGRRVSIFWWVL